MPKVLYVGFGISPIVRGGAVIYQESLVEAVNSSGWEAVCFFAAPRYSRAMNPRPLLREWKRRGVKFIELYDPPNSYGYFNSPCRQCRNPDVERLMENVLDRESPDIVHFHELQMHSASVIDAARRRNIPSLKTMHNYFDICPQRDLMFNAQEPCLDFDNGIRCVSCLKILPKKKASFRRRIALALAPRRIRDDKPLTISAVDYRFRREFFVERLNKLDAVHCSSRRSAEIFVSYGLLREKIRVLPLSVKNLEHLEVKPVREARLPVVFGYVGGRYMSRGYQTLIDAFSRIDQSKARLIIFSNNKEGFPPDLNLEIRSPYEPDGINKAFQDIDVGIVPSVWEEIFGIIGIEWLTAGIPVIGSNIGGIPEWLKDGENGFLVAAGDSLELSGKMGLFVKNPELIAQFQRRIKPWKTFRAHIEEMTDLYAQLIRDNGGYQEL